MDPERLLSLPVGEVDFVAFDTETAMHAPLDRIVEIAGVRFRGGEITAEFATLVDPASPIAPAAMAVHGIDDAAVRGAPDATRAIGDFIAFAGDAVLVAHHAPFDATVLAGEMARSRTAFPGNAILDTRLLARALVQVEGYGLENLVRVLGLPVGRHHRALADAHHVVHLLGHLFARIGDPGVVPMREVMRRHAPMGFARYAPEPPPLSDELRALGTAAEQGEPVTIDYAAEGGRIAPRRVTPRLLFRRDGIGYFEALDHETGLVKSYRLDRVRGLRAEVDQGLLF